MVGLSCSARAAIWLGVIYSTPVNCRWVKLEEWGQKLNIIPNLQTTQVREEHQTVSTVMKVWDTDEEWTSGNCINDILLEDGTALRKIEYYPGNPSPLFPWVLSGIEVHDGNDCKDKNRIIIIFPTDPTGEPEIYGTAEQNQDTAEQLIFGGSQDHIWTSNTNEVQSPDPLNDPTLVEEQFEQNPEDFDTDEVASMTNLQDDVWGQDLGISGEALPQQQVQYEPTEIVEESEYSDQDLGGDDGGGQGGGNNLKKRSPVPPNSQADEESDEDKGLLSWGFPGQGVIDVGTNPVANNPSNLQLPMPRFHTQPMEQDNFSDEIIGENPQIPGMGGTKLDQLTSPDLNPLGTQDVLDLDPLVVESREIPFEDDVGDPGFKKVNLLEYGLRFRKPTSVRFVSDLSQWYRIPAGGIQTIDGFERASR
ncbi:hypothetical protein TWF730_010469 [Orbilia blumenaviensis]|uniref:Uncharacterized protein n=1 Tax=Orbilia blumenaviensis TaxID=1796055 RepID=A0AAV9UNC2_9PEZI